MKRTTMERRAGKSTRLEWIKRRQRQTLDSLGVRYVRRSLCRRYHVVEFRSDYGLPRRFYLMGDTMADLLSVHRTENAARNAARKHNRRSNANGRIRNSDRRAHGRSDSRSVLDAQHV